MQNRGPTSPGETPLFHAAAGGVGLIACPWLKALGATAIGTLVRADVAELFEEGGLLPPCRPPSFTRWPCAWEKAGTDQ